MKMLTMLLIAFALTVPAANAQKMSDCGLAVHHSTKKVKGKDPIELAPLPAGKALVYVVRPTHFGAAIQTKLSMDGKWMGVNMANSYFVFLADPGEHKFCSQSENASRLSLTLEAGKTYFLQQHIRSGFFKAENELTQLDDKHGHEALDKCKRIIFWEKGKPRPAT
ncbi:MAG TPA: DUF2846 domain-containing protein [Candidatus Acidoferrales bacterium]|nr:DUF2846 domain-containing protein [Candidatus Acidoferrales bacterium]